MGKAENRRVFQRPVNKAIKSAEVVTGFRALGALEKDQSIRNPDHLAKYFLGPWYRLILTFNRLLLKYTKRVFDRMAPGSYWYFFVRTKHIDKILLDELKKGFEQFVILGAGYDSRSYRFQNKLNGVEIFELDFPGTQVRKKKLLKKLYGKVPEHVNYVPINFNSQSIKDALTAKGYHPGKKTFFIWEGVTFYLAESAIDKVLEFVKTNARPGSSIVFDYAIRSFIKGNHSTYGSRQIFNWWQKVGEPGIFGIEERAVGNFLEKRGFKVISDLGPEELEQRYIDGRNGSQNGRIFGCMRMVHSYVHA